MTVFLIAWAVSCSRGKDEAKSVEPPPAAAPATPAASSSPKGEVAVATEGPAYGLRIEGASLTYCDKRGARKLDLASGQESAGSATCGAPEEANAACTGLAGLDVSVRAPGGDDIVDVEGQSFPMRGKVQDCAALGKRVVVASPGSILLIDADKGVSKDVAPGGADRVAMGGGWVVWTDGAKIRAAAAP
ncbi:MAG: hypothetical protein JNL98_27150 [Bryobacterales bacterium]|nr:hypothetical protein [Bryobacterales bacterium]